MARSTRSTRRCATASATAFPLLDKVHLTDYKVRILDGATATGAIAPCAHRLHQRRARPGPRSGSAATSSRRRGGRSRTASSTACCTRPADPRAPDGCLAIRSDRPGSGYLVAMAAPTVRSHSPSTTPVYGSPASCRRRGCRTAPATSSGSSPTGDRLGYQGPDQGFALKIANGFTGSSATAAGRARRRRGQGLPRASPCDARRCSAGRRSCTTSPSRSRCGASSTPRHRRSWSSAASRCSPASGNRPTTTSEARALVDQVPRPRCG